MKVCKFGGSSLACSQCVAQAVQIIKSDKERKIVVVSAPGKGGNYTKKVTDQLINFYNKDDQSLHDVLDRFLVMAKTFDVDITEQVNQTKKDLIENKKNKDFVLSRGEYLMAVLMAKILGYKFLDAKDYILINANGLVNQTVTKKLLSKISVPCVMGGFYGFNTRGSIKTFDRGGSDYTGAVIACLTTASLYENFTDRNGVLSANPIIEPKAKNVAKLNYNQMHTLSLGGASVIYPGCLPLLKKYKVKLRVDNTFNPGKVFTTISHDGGENKFFSIAYNTYANINKDMCKITIVFNGTTLNMAILKQLFKTENVILLHSKKNVVVLNTELENLSLVVGVLHSYFQSKIG